MEDKGRKEVPGRQQGTMVNFDVDLIVLRTT